MAARTTTVRCMGYSSYEYDDTEFSIMDLVGVPPYGPIASAAEENNQLAVAIVIAIADIMTGILSLEYLVCFECPTDVVALTLLPYAVTLAYFAGMECAFMTTVGRRALRLRATGIDGERPSVRGINNKQYRQDVHSNNRRNARPDICQGSAPEDILQAWWRHCREGSGSQA